MQCDLCPEAQLLQTATTSAICDTDSMQPPQRELCGCALYEAHLGWQASFPSD